MFRLILTAAALAVICSFAFADTIVLTNGGKLYGKIVKEKTNDKEVTIQLPNKGEITVNRDQIERIEINEIKGPRLGPPSKSPLVPAQPKKKPLTQPEKEKPQPGKPVEEKKKEEPLDPELKEKIELYIKQLGLSRRQHRGRRNNAMAELTKIGKPAVPFVIEALKSGKNSKAKWGAARVLGNIGDKRATEPLIKRLRDSDNFVRKESVEALRKITSKSFGYDPEGNPQLRSAAAKKWEEWWQKQKEEEEKRKAEELKKKEQDAPTPKGQAGKPQKKAPTDPKRTPSKPTD